MKHPFFSESCLYITPRSPFARRVRLAFLESEVSFITEICDVFHPTQELLSLNPLGRVPFLKTKDGDLLIDSNLILQAFYQSVNSPLMPQESAKRFEVFYWGGVMTGLCEKMVEAYLDSLRPQEYQDPDLKKELLEFTDRILEKMEHKLAKNGGQTIVGDHLTQADIDSATALTYFSLRFSKDWKKNFVKTSLYLLNLEAREHFKKTAPLL